MTLRWKFRHSGLDKLADNKISAYAHIVLEKENSDELIHFDVENAEEFNQVSRRILTDTAHQLEKIAREMKAKADTFRG